MSTVARRTHGGVGQGVHPGVVVARAGRGGAGEGGHVSEREELSDEQGGQDNEALSELCGDLVTLVVTCDGPVARDLVADLAIARAGL